MRNILFIITYLELGGAQKHLLNILKDIDLEEFRVDLISGESGYLKDKFLELPGINVHIIPELKRSLNPYCDFVAFLKIFKLIKSGNFDIVHVHSPKASFLGRWAAYLAGVKNIIYTVHGWPFHKFMNGFGFYLYLFLEKITAPITSRFIVVSEYDLKIGLDRLTACPEKFTLIHYGVDTSRLNLIFNLRKNKPPEDKLVLNISALKMQKGLFYFLEAAKTIVQKHKDTKFLLIGDGPERKKIEQKIKELGLEGKVILKGWVEELNPYFESARILVLSSLWEGLPIAVIEAVACGIPVIVTNTGGVGEVLKQDRQGMIVEPGQTQQLIVAIENMLNDYNNWQNKVYQNRSDFDVDYWSEERMLAQINRIFLDPDND